MISLVPFFPERGEGGGGGGGEGRKKMGAILGDGRAKIIIITMHQKKFGWTEAQLVLQNILCWPMW